MNKTAIILEILDGKPHLWVDQELIKKFTPNTSISGKPLEMAEAIHLALATVGIDAVIHIEVDKPC